MAFRLFEKKDITFMRIRDGYETAIRTDILNGTKIPVPDDKDNVNGFSEVYLKDGQYYATKPIDSEEAIKLMNLAAHDQAKKDPEYIRSVLFPKDDSQETAAVGFGDRKDKNGTKILLTEAQSNG